DRGTKSGIELRGNAGKDTVEQSGLILVRRLRAREPVDAARPPRSLAGIIATTVTQSSEHHLHRRFGLVQATALNMINMIGIGPFITVPLLMTALGGPQALAGWIIALFVVICDGLVWSELGAAMPVSGGSFGYL